MATAYELDHGGPRRSPPVRDDCLCVCGHLMTQHADGGTGRCQACALRTSPFMLPGCTTFFSVGVPTKMPAPHAPQSEEAVWSLNVASASIRLATVHGCVTRTDASFRWMVGRTLDDVSWWAWRHNGYVELMQAPASTRRVHEVVG